MVRLGPGFVVVLRFPFSDLSSSKFRPAVALAHRTAAGLASFRKERENPMGDQRHLRTPPYNKSPPEDLVRKIAEYRLRAVREREGNAFW